MALSSVVLPAHAALADLGFALEDTNTDTLYLKPVLVQGLSYNDVVVNDVFGWISQGWSVSSQSALVDLYASYGSGVSDYMLDGGSASMVSNNDLFGGQVSLPGTVVVDYWSSSSIFPALDQFSAAQVGIYSVSLSISGDDYFSEVPIPAAAWLFGSALLGLGAMKRKKA